MDRLLKTIPVIDSHLHLWDIDRLSYRWLNSVPAIKKSFFIEDYQEAARNFQIEKMVFIQAECGPEENLQEIAFVMEQVSKDPRIQGIIAYAPLEKGKEIRRTVNLFRENILIKGVRRMYDDTPDICYSSSFLDGVNLLAGAELSFDLSIRPASIPATIKMIRNCPDTQFILDHLGKPDIKHQTPDDFRRNIDFFASSGNVVAKISGLITEADKANWKAVQLLPYIKHAVQCFGYDRLLFGSDWPVVLSAGSFEQWLDALQEILCDCSIKELHKLFYENAARVYRL